MSFSREQFGFRRAHTLASDDLSQPTWAAVGGIQTLEEKAGTRRKLRFFHEEFGDRCSLLEEAKREIIGTTCFWQQSQEGKSGRGKRIVAQSASPQTAFPPTPACCLPVCLVT